MVRVKEFMPPKGDINHETPTGRAVEQYLVWHNFSCCRLDFYAIGGALFILPYFPVTFILDSVNGCICPFAVLYNVRRGEQTYDRY